MAIHYKVGNLLDSNAQTLINTVNCVGVMGKGIALEFKRRYPAMYRRYTERCEAGEVQLGRPYLERERDHLIVNFPTKGHWRASSRIDDVRAGLIYLRDHIKDWKIQSIAVPPLGCGQGGLSWEDVRPLIEANLGDLDIEVELFVPPLSDEAAKALPHSAKPESKQLLFFD